MTKIILVITMLFTTSCSLIRPGETGILFNKLTGSLSQGDQGYYFWLPFREVQTYPISLRTYTMVQRSGEGSAKDDDSIDLPSAEGQHVRQDLSVTYNTNEKSALDVYKSFKGEDIDKIEKTYIRRTIITVSQNIAGRMSLTELIATKREQLQLEIEKSLMLEIAKMGFTLDKVNLGAAHLPKSVEHQMQQKMAAQQEAQRAEYELQKQKTLALSRLAEAEGVAKSNAVMSASLTANILERMKLEKWNGVLPTVTGSSGQMINLK
jgi:regulator of protease activity HflC (stomatin/prohibitin superfamily)